MALGSLTGVVQVSSHIAQFDPSVIRSIQPIIEQAKKDRAFKAPILEGPAHPHDRGSIPNRSHALPLGVLADGGR
jgi:hypothetical protein